MFLFNHIRDYYTNTNVMQETHVITDVNTIAERLKQARDEQNLSQKQLAKKSGVSQGTIGNVESGARKDPRELLAIARALGVDPEWLKSGNGRKNTNALERAAEALNQRTAGHHPDITPTQTLETYLRELSAYLSVLDEGERELAGVLLSQLAKKPDDYQRVARMLQGSIDAANDAAKTGRRQESISSGKQG